MKHDWITIALENGGVLTSAKDADGINASMHWENGAEVCGENHSTLPDALTSLNSALEDDAAEECCPSNVKVVAPPSLESDCGETEKLMGGCSPTACSTSFEVSYREAWRVWIEGKEWWVAKDNGELMEPLSLRAGSGRFSGLNVVPYGQTNEGGS